MYVTYQTSKIEGGFGPVVPFKERMFHVFHALSDCVRLVNDHRRARPPRLSAFSEELFWNIECRTRHEAKPTDEVNVD